MKNYSHLETELGLNIKKHSVVKFSFRSEVFSPSSFLIQELEIYLLESLDVILL